MNEFYADDVDQLVIGIGEAARLIGVPAHTIRYWEREFDFYLNPSRTVGRQRRYADEDISRLRRIHTMLKEDGYSIAGARRALSREASPLPKVQLPEPASEMVSRLTDMIRQELMHQLAAAR